MSPAPTRNLKEAGGCAGCCRAGANARTLPATTHVEVHESRFSDAGSIPAASTILRSLARASDGGADIVSLGSKYFRRIVRAKNGGLRSLARRRFLLTFNRASNIPSMFYTYILESLSHPSEQYIGHTSDLRQRLIDHNAGKCTYTSRYIPWKVKLYIAFDSIELARNFEKYLKSGSGHAFAKKHFCE